MKKRVIAILMSFAMIAAIVGCGSKSSGFLDEAAATREYDPNDTTFYMPETFVPLADSADTAELRAMAKAALVLVNKKRAEKGKGELEWSQGLEQAAQIRANECEEKFSHTRPNGTDYWTVDGNLVYGENLATGYETAEDVVPAWVASPTHNANLMAADFATCSIAVHTTDSGEIYWAQEFGY